MTSEHGLDATTEAPGRPIIAAVLKAAALVECFTRQTREMSLRDLVRATGYPTTTVHRLLATLERAGWVVRRQAGYSLSLRLAEIAQHVLSGIDLREEARPLMRELSKQTGETTYLVMRQDDHAVCVERIEGDRMVRVMAWDVGSTLPLFAGAAPLALLAYEEPAEIDRLLDLHPLVLPTGRTVDKKEMRTRLARVRSQGYSLSAEETIEGITSVGVPILNNEGKAAAALSIGGLSSGFTGPRLAQLVAALVDVGRRLSRQLGYAPPPVSPPQLR